MPEGQRAYYIMVFGCQMNDRDAAALAGLLESLGYAPAREPEEADIILVHTCCVRESAERKVYGRIGQLSAYKQRRPDLIIGVGGCMTQQAGVADDLARRFPHVNFVFGTFNLDQLPEFIARAADGEAGIVDIRRGPGGPDSRGFQDCAQPLPAGGGLKALVNITMGCDNYCSYCIVPYVRGPMRSRPPEAVELEVRRAVGAGARDVTLLGQNVNAYGIDRQGLPSFAALLRRLDELDTESDFRLRFTTSHPRDFTDDIIKAVAACRRACEHIHLPVQAGSDRVLTLMNRGYTAAAYLDILRRIRRTVPGVSITTDLIVGFPGETDEDSRATLDLVRKARFDAAFTFMYSPRSGTAAAALPGAVPLAERKARLGRLMEVQYPISLEINQGLVGETVDVLVEGPSKKDPRMLTGRTRQNKIVHFPGDPALSGSCVPVRVTGAQTWTLRGELAGRGEGS